MLKSDGEAAITGMKDKIASLREGPTVSIETPARESKCNGAMEARVKTRQGMFRTMLLDLQKNLGTSVPLGSNAVSWLVHWSATVLNRYKLDKHGRTAYQRVAGSVPRRPIAKFGERIWFIPNGKRNTADKANLTYVKGIP